MATHEMDAYFAEAQLAARALYVALRRQQFCALAPNAGLAARAPRQTRNVLFVRRKSVL